MKWKNGFYMDDEAPEGAVAITDKLYDELLQGQRNGYSIVDDNGFPKLKTVTDKTVVSQITALKAELRPIMEDIEQEGLGIARDDYAEKKARAADIINELRVLEGKEAREIIKEGQA